MSEVARLPLLPLDSKRKLCTRGQARRTIGRRPQIRARRSAKIRPSPRLPSTPWASDGASTEIFMCSTRLFWPLPTAQSESSLSRARRESRDGVSRRNRRSARAQPQLRRAAKYSEERSDRRRERRDGEHKNIRSLRYFFRPRRDAVCWPLFSANREGRRASCGVRYGLWKRCSPASNGRHDPSFRGPQFSVVGACRRTWAFTGGRRLVRSTVFHRTIGRTTGGDGTLREAFARERAEWRHSAAVETRNGRTPMPKLVTPRRTEVKDIRGVPGCLRRGRILLVIACSNVRQSPARVGSVHGESGSLRARGPSAGALARQSCRDRFVTLCGGDARMLVGFGESIGRRVYHGNSRASDRSSQFSCFFFARRLVSRGLSSVWCLR